MSSSATICAAVSSRGGSRVGAIAGEAKRVGSISGGRGMDVGSDADGSAGGKDDGFVCAA